MVGLPGRRIWIEVDRCVRFVHDAITLFGRYINLAPDTQSRSCYYQARGNLRRATEIYGEIVQEARRIARPPTEHASEELMARKRKLLEDDRILVRGKAGAELERELLQDDLLRKWLGAEEIRRLLAHYLEQQEIRRRQLPNIKLRILLAYLDERLKRAQELEAKAKTRYETHH